MTISTLYSPDLSAYTETGQRQKEKFHREARKICRTLARHLELPRGTFNVRTNMGGIAVPGETILHHENFYLMLGGMFGGGIMYRKCNGLKDYTGGQNNFAPMSALDDPKQFAERLRPLAERSRPYKSPIVRVN